MRIDYAKAGMKLAQDVYDERGNLLLEKGIALTDSYIKRLKILGINNVFVHHPSASFTPDPCIPEELQMELSLCFRALLNMKAEDILSNKLQTMYFRQIGKAADKTVHELEKCMPNILNIKVRMPRTDEVDHAINVCVLSVITGLYLRLPKSTLHELAVGALLHDFGKSVIPLVDGRPTNSPALHTLYGRDLLLKHKQGRTVARIAAEHHEYYDGTGYPLGLAGKATHPLSRIVAIADYFDNAMTLSMSGGVSRQEILEEMLASGDVLFDLNILRAFLCTTAIYPAGSLVLLSTGQTACVVKNHASFPMRPLVRIQRDSGYEDIDLLHRPTTTIVDLIDE